VSHIVCTIHAYDVMSQVTWSVAAIDIDLPPDDEGRFWYAAGTLDGEGIEDMSTWVRDVCVDIIESI